MLTYTKRQGVSGGVETVQVQADSASGGYAPLVGRFDGSEDLLCLLWPGDDQAVTATLPATWNDAQNGRVDVTFSLDVMTALDVTWYDAMLKLADGSLDLAAFRLVVTPGPGAATADKAYHTYKDLVDEMPLVAKLADQLNDQSGFREAAAESRRWIDAAILERAPNYCTGDWIYGGLWGYGGGVGRSWVDGPIGWRGDWMYGSHDQAENTTIAAALDADALMITTATGRRFVRASVFKTLAAILRRAVGSQSTNDLLTLSDKYDSMAERMLSSCVAQIDVNGDGTPEYVIALGGGRMRRA